MDPLAGRLVEQLQDDPEAPEVVGLEGEDADVIFDALSSETTRAVLSKCYDGGRTRSELADELDTSIQNVSYHVEKLEGAGLIEPAEIRYGENRQEVRVYEPSKEAVLIAAGETGVVDRLKHTVKRLLSPVLLLGLFSAAVAAVVRGIETIPFGLGDAPEDAAVAPEEEAFDAEVAEDDAPPADDDVADAEVTDDDVADAEVEEEYAAPDDADVVEEPDAERMDATDAEPETVMETVTTLVTEPWLFAGVSVFLLGLVLVVTADRFGAFDRGPQRERTGYRATLLGSYTATTWRYLVGALALALGAFLLFDASMVAPTDPIGTAAGVGLLGSLLAGAVAGIVHAYRNRGLLVTAAVTIAPLLGAAAYLFAAPVMGDGSLWAVLVGLAGLAAVAVLAGLPIGAITYGIGRAARRVRGGASPDDDQP